MKLDSLQSSMSGVTAIKLIDKLIENGVVTMEDMEEVYHQRIHSSKEDLYLARVGVIDKRQKYLLQVIR